MAGVAQGKTVCNFWEEADMKKRLAEMEKSQTSLVAIVLILVGLFSEWASAVEAMVEPAQGLYPSIYLRGSEFKGTHCVPMPASMGARELYFLNTTPEVLNKGKVVNVDVAEFFSGRRYRATLATGENYRVNLSVDGAHIDLDCASKSSLGVIDKNHPINASGDYLNLERIGMTGQFGDLSLDNRCDAGDNGWVDCDIGTFGLSRRSADGKIRWARLIAVGVPTKEGHSLYRLPKALRVIDQFDFATLLEDGTAVLTFFDIMSIRIDMSNGTLFEQRSDVAVVPLQDWAELKRITSARWLGSARPCRSSDANCEQRLIEMYFYTLQNYLFPLK